MDEQDEVIATLYTQCQPTVDELPYTDEFERLYESAHQVRPDLARRDLWRRLANLRKRGLLARKRR